MNLNSPKLTVLFLKNKKLFMASRNADDSFALRLIDHHKTTFRLLASDHNLSVFWSVGYSWDLYFC